MPQQVRIAFLAPNGVQQTWNMQVPEPVTPERVLAQLRAERPDMQTVQSVERIDGAVAAPELWPASPPPQPQATQSRRKLVILAVVVVVVAVVIGVAVSLSNSRDEPSYQIGIQTGARYAQQFNMVTADGLTENLLSDACDTMSRYSTYEEFDRKDFVDGCIDGARAVYPG